MSFYSAHESTGVLTKVHCIRALLTVERFASIFRTTASATGNGWADRPTLSMIERLLTCRRTQLTQVATSIYCVSTKHGGRIGRVLSVVGRHSGDATVLSDKW